MENNSTIAFFDRCAARYDEVQPALVPFYKEAIAIVADACAHHAPGGAILDLGCGTGNTSARILERSPGSRVFLLDGSAAMMEIASKKISAAFGPQAILGTKVANLEDPEWHRWIAGPIDAIASAFVLEHLDEADYKAVIGACRGLLKPGGTLVTMEFSDAFGMKEWFYAEMQRRGEAHPQYRQIIEDSKASEQHFYVDLDRKLEWIRSAGYKNVHTIWQYLFAYVVVSEA